MTIKNTIVKGLTAAVLATGAVAGFSGSAWAGGNGQQITFHDRAGVASVRIAGLNQNGQYVSHCFSVAQGGDTNLGGWWWKGKLSVKGYGDGGCGDLLWQPDRQPTVPTSQSGDWFYIAD
ncbi:hypothetical protein [Streptomyces sp. NPDC001678]|uniref:hypothetical protein n=1 Tax=Streptomyces sp. NPDC001678 TaxID=3364599 RepID=UPI0036745D8F